MTTPTAIIARQTWNFLGKALGHGALAYGAHKSVDYFQGQQGWLSWANPLNWLNPFPKAKKFFAWMGLEGAAHIIHKPVSEAWEKATPIAVQWMTPHLEPTVEATLKLLEENGFITRNWGNTWAGTLWNFTTAPVRAPLNTINNLLGRTQITPPPPPPSSELITYVVNGIKMTGEELCKYAMRFPHMLQAISDATGIPYHIVLAGTLGMGWITYSYLSSGWERMTQTQNVRVANTNTAAANSTLGGVHFDIHLGQQGRAGRQATAGHPPRVAVIPAPEGEPDEPGAPVVRMN